jgi:hypothetical protein
LGDQINAAATTDVTDVSRGTHSAVTITGGNNVSVTNSGAVTVGGTTATDPAGTVTVTNSGTGAVAIDGGTAVTLTETGSGAINIDQAVASTGAITVTDTGLTSGTIKVGLVTGTDALATVSSATAPTGAVTVNATSALAPISGTLSTGGAITVGGGSTITINDNAAVTSASAAAIAADVTAADNYTVKTSAVVAVGGAATTAVTVNQSAAVAPVAVAAASGGVTTTTAAVAAAPGVQAVAASSTTTPVVAAVSAVLGVTNNTDVITDVNAASATKAGTIATVTADNYSTLKVYDNALATLNATGGGNISVVSALTTQTQTSLALNLNSVSGTFSNSNTTTASGLYKTLNVTTSGAASTLSSITDAALANLNVAGTQTLTASLTAGQAVAVAVSGSAGFNDAGTFAAATGSTLTTTSSGAITATLNATAQTFTGSTGQDIITINADATKVITGGSATNNEIVLNNAATTFTAANTVANVTGFTTLGTNTGSSGTFDLSVLTGFKAIDVQDLGPTQAETFTKVTAGSALSIDATSAGAQTAGGIVYQTSDTAGSSDSLALTLGSAANQSDISVFSLTLEDANLVGLGTVNLVSNDNGKAAGATGVNTITTLVDNGLSVLNVSGTGALTIGTLNEASTQATSFTLNNTDASTVSTAGSSDSLALTLGAAANQSDISVFSLTLEDANLVGLGTVNLVSNDNGKAAGATGVNTITTLVDNGLSVLNVSGTGALTIGTLNEASTQATSFTLNNTDASTVSTGVTIGTFTDVSLGTLNFTGTGASFIGTLNDNSSVININNTDSAGATITTLYDAVISSATSLTLGFTGSGATTLTNLENTSTTTTAMTINDSTSGNVTISQVNNGTLAASNPNIVTETYNNTGTGVLTVSADYNASVTSLTLKGDVVYNNTGGTATHSSTGFYDTANSGVTVAAGTDNAHLNLMFSGTTSTATTGADTITVGNGNNYIVDGSTVGTVNVTVGTGSNLINLGTAATDASTASYSVTLGTHTSAGPDQVMVGGAYSAATTTTSVVLPTAQNLTVTGAVAGDWISFSNDASGAISVTATTAATTAGSTAAATITAVENAAGASAHGFAFSVFGGNTYVAEAASALVANGANAANVLTVIELVGTHTFTGATGHVVIA